ncbi:MAG: PhnD/SsuA/transferrin family substrate-binding protein [Actinobacteria bacterium]|nr:PhnD/SsuA/transferrin family substrate-binding protein [Actinomycetota bacterium]
MANLHVALVSRTYYYVPYWAAQRQRFFADEGLEVTGEILDSTGKVNLGLKDGSYQIGIGTPEGVVADVENGPGDLVIVAGNADKLTHVLIALPRYQRIEDLRGARIGVASLNEGTAFVVQEMLRPHGLSHPHDYDLVNAGGVPSRWRKLREGGIDAGLQSIPISYAAEDAGFPNLGDSTDYVPDYQFTTVNVHRQWAEQHQAELTAALRALRRGTEWMYDNREAAIDVIVEELDVGRAHATRGWEHYVSKCVLPRDMRVSEPGMRAVLGIMSRAGTLRDQDPMDPDRYVDRSFLGDL